MVATAKALLDIAYDISGVVLAIAAVIGLQQIRVLKKDVKTRNERAAKEKAIEYAGRYLGRYVQLDSEWMLKRDAEKLPKYEGPIGDFTRASIPVALREKMAKRFASVIWLQAINELAAISAAFVHGVADEEVGFCIIGRTFCAAVETDYDIIAFGHSEDVHPHYESIVSLYKTWKPRLSAAEMRHARSKLDAQLAKTKTTRISSIGTE